MKKMKRWLGLSLMAVFAFIISVSSVACRGGGTLTRVIVKDTVDNLIADENVQLGGFSGWDMTKGIPLSQPIIDILYPAAAE